MRQPSFRRFASGLFSVAVTLSQAPSALAAAAHVAHRPPVRTVRLVVHGRVESSSGSPISHVFVHQENGLTSTFTNARGEFALTVDLGAAPQVILFSALDRLPVRISVADAGRPVVMVPAPVVCPPSMLPSPVPVTPAQARVLDSGFAVRGDYRSQEYVAQGANSVSGAVDGEFGLNLSDRRGNWLVDLDAMRYRPAVNVPGLSASSATTFAPEALEGTLALGYLFHPGFDIGPYLVGYGRSASSFANGAQYSGTPLDWNDSRWSAGLGGQVGGWIYRPWHLAADGRLEGYFLTNDRLSGGTVPAQLSALHGAKAEVQLDWEFIPQVRLQAGYQHELWRAFGYAEDADVWMVGLGYYPGSPRP